MREWTGEDERALSAQADALRRALGRAPEPSEIAGASGLPVAQVLAMQAEMAGRAGAGALTRSVLGPGASLDVLTAAGVVVGPGGHGADRPAGGWAIRLLDGLAPHRFPDAGTVLFRFVCDCGRERVILDARDLREGIGLAACLRGTGGMPIPGNGGAASSANPYRDGDEWAGTAFAGGTLLDDPFRRYGPAYLDWIEGLAPRGSGTGFGADKPSRGP